MYNVLYRSFGRGTRNMVGTLSEKDRKERAEVWDQEFEKTRVREKREIF